MKSIDMAHHLLLYLTTVLVRLRDVINSDRSGAMFISKVQLQYLLHIQICVA